MYFRTVILLLVIILLTACENMHEYRVDSEFSEYIHRFEIQASKYGRNIDIEKEGLIMTFANLDDDIAGICYYEKPIRIKIDSNFWNRTKYYASTDLMRENLIFHELGHGFLKRSHTNDFLENGEWKSIMCGGTKINGHSWNLNYNGVRRDYYISELFNESTKAPAFMSTTLTADTTGMQTLISFDFNTGNIEDTGWELITKASYSISRESGQLKFTSAYSSPRVFLLSLQSSLFNTAQDFAFEAYISGNSALASDQFGLATSTSTNIADTIEYFKISNEKKMYPGNSSAYGFYCELDKPEIIRNTFNHLKIMQLNDILYYFLNNEFMYCTESITHSFGQYIGIVVPGNSTVYVDEIRISVRNQSSKIKRIRAKISDTSKIITLPNNNYPNK